MSNPSQNSPLHQTTSINFRSTGLLKQLVLLALLFVVSLPSTVFANGFNYSLVNQRDTIIGVDTFQLSDVFVSNLTATPKKIGFGKLFFEYNVNAMGQFLGINPSTEIKYPQPYLLGTQEQNSMFNNYFYVITGIDPVAPNLFYVSWDQYIAEECLLEEVTQVPRRLFGLKLKYASGGTNFSPDVCFFQDSLYIDQVYSSCGPFSGMSCAPGDFVADCQGHVGSAITLNTYECSFTSSNEVTDQSFSYTVFPNPTDSYLTIELEGTHKAEYQLFDVHGRLLDTGVFREQVRLETDDLVVGTYFLRLGVGDSFRVEKVVVLR